MFKNFKSSFSVLCEEEVKKFTSGGVLAGEFCVIRKDALKNPKISEKPTQFVDKVKELMNSDLPLKIGSVKSMKAETSNGLYGGADAPDYFYVDVVQCLTPATFQNVITLPIEAIDVVTPEGNNWSPSMPDSWSYKDKTNIKPEAVKDAKGELEHQTQASKRKTATKDTKGLGKSAVDGRDQVDKPKESKDFVKDDVELMAEVYNNIK